jgi:SOS-response transcriptional repressor LexA
LTKIADACGVSVGWLVSGEGQKHKASSPSASNAPFVSGLTLNEKTDTPIPTPVLTSGPAMTGRVPLISWVQAGDWSEVIDQFQAGFTEEWVNTGGPVGSHGFALKVQGDSMEPEFVEGDIIIVDPERDPVSGQFVVAKNGEGEATFKRFMMDGSRIYLVPLNRRYPVVEVTENNVKIVGVVVEKVKRYV